MRYCSLMKSLRILKKWKCGEQNRSYYILFNSDDDACLLFFNEELENFEKNEGEQNTGRCLHTITIHTITFFYYYLIPMMICVYCSLMKSLRILKKVKVWRTENAGFVQYLLRVFAHGVLKFNCWTGDTFKNLLLLLLLPWLKTNRTLLFIISRM